MKEKQLTTRQKLNRIIKAIQEKQGENIVSIDLTKLKYSFCDVFVIASASSKAQLNTIADFIEEYLIKDAKVKVWKTEGKENSEWIILDYADIVVHLFLDEKRKYYKIEELWADGKTTIW